MVKSLFSCCRVPQSEDVFLPPPPLPSYPHPESSVAECVDRLRTAINTIENIAKSKKNEKLRKLQKQKPITEEELTQTVKYIFNHRQSWKIMARNRYICPDALIHLPLAIHYNAKNDFVLVQLKSRLGALGGIGGFVFVKYSIHFDQGLPYVNRFCNKLQLKYTYKPRDYEAIDPYVFVIINKTKGCVPYTDTVEYISPHIYIASGWRQTNACPLYAKDSLAEFIKNNPNEPMPWLSSALINLMQTLQTLHDANIAWRDIKEENLFIDDEWNLLVGDPFLAINLTHPSTSFKVAGTEMCLPKELRTLRATVPSKTEYQKGDVFSMELVLKLLEDKGKLNIPLNNENAFKELRNAMSASDFNKRPSFDEIAERLKEIFTLTT